MGAAEQYADVADGQDALGADLGLRQGRLAPPAEDDALVEPAEVVGEEVEFDVLEPGVDQLAHLPSAEDLAHRADEHEDAARHEEIDRVAEEGDLLPTAPSELVVEGRIQVNHRERVPRDAGRLEAARAEQADPGMGLGDDGGAAGVQLDGEDVAR